jgi:tRNA (guanine26-N2/guanine27-N2)-dimethyltransferase
MKNNKIDNIIEGDTKVLVYKKKNTLHGPSSKGKEPFYNPAMELNRDLSILICQWLLDEKKSHIKLLDGLAASGIRGIRFANELNGDFEVKINDWDKNSYKLITKNNNQYKFDNVIIYNKNLNILLCEEKFHYIDIDPFGTPVYFLDSAMRSIQNNGIIACTATDTATLCGVYPKVCRRRYNAEPCHSYMMHETGLRILIGYICREAGKYDKAIEPLVCYSTDHYFRAYIKIINNVSYANESGKNYRILNTEDLDFFQKYKTNIGPLWIGKLFNKNFIKELRNNLFEKNLNKKYELIKLLDIFEEESDAPYFFYTTDNLSSSLKLPPPKLKVILNTLKNIGYLATRTHFSPTGFKTDASKKEIEKNFKK